MTPLDDLLTPISDSSPAGVDLRYEAVYDEIRKEREEEADLPQGAWQRERKTADFQKVIKLATEALAKRSKDLQIAAWLTEAKLRREGFGGLHEGIELLRGLMSHFWDDLYPPIEDDDVEFRAAPLEWLGNYLEPSVKRVPLNGSGHDWFDYTDGRALGTEEEAEQDSSKAAKRQQGIDDGKVTIEEFEEGFAATPKAWYKQLASDLRSAGTSLDSLEGESDERFGEFAPSYRKLREAMGEVEGVAAKLLEAKLEKEPDPPGESEVEHAEDGGGDLVEAGEAVPAPGAARPTGSSGGTVSLDPSSRDDAGRRIAAAARFLRRDDPRDPAAYLLVRGFRWGELRGGGDTVDPRLLAAPSTETRTRLKSLLLDGAWGQLLDQAEEVMGTSFGRGWLDLQRYVFTALDGLGAEYGDVRSAVRGALIELLRALPRLPELTLMDDSPTANRETQLWLREEGVFDAFSEDVTKELSEGSSGRRTPPVRDVTERAREKARAGQPQKAIELLLDAADQERSDRSRFLRRSEAARIMVESELESVAMPILRDMLKKIEEHHLEDWESGETIAQPLGLLYRCILKLESGSPEKDDLYLRVCRLDPMQAIHFSPGSAEGHGAPEPEVEEADGQAEG